MTGQCRQITAALRCAAPRTNSSSGSEDRQRALDTQAIRASAAAACAVICTALAVVLRAAGREPDTSAPLRSAAANGGQYGGDPKCDLRHTVQAAVTYIALSVQS